MSDTPRTDRNYIGMQIVPATFAQQLERELNAANERIKRLEEAGDFLELCLTGEEPFRSCAKTKWRKAKEAKP